MANVFLQFLEEDNGNLSAMRLLVSLILVVVLFNWTYITILTGNFVGLNVADIMLILGPLAVKSYQKGKEKNVG